MPSTMKEIFRRNARPTRRRKSTLQEPELEGGVSLQDSMSNMDMMDADLFSYDYERWFAKAIFQFSLAMVIQKHYQGRAYMNPKDLLAQMEASYRVNCPGNIGHNENISYPAIFSRINAARTTESEATLATFLDELSNDINRHCRLQHEGNVAELDAQPLPNDHATPSTAPLELATSDSPSVEEDSTATDADEDTGNSSQDHHATPSAAPLELATSDSPSVEEESTATDTDEDTGNSSPDESEHSPLSSRPNSSPVSQPSDAEAPMHTYTSKVFYLAVESGGKPDFKFEACPNSWTCVASLDGCHGTGEAQKKKDAQHLASRMLCQMLEDREESGL